MRIHPTAIIEHGAQIHETVAVGPYSIIERGAEIGAETVIDSCVRITGRTRLGCRNRVHHGVVLGGDPQDLGFTPERAKPLRIGDDNCFREHVTVNAGLKSDTGTRVGNGNYLMAYAHVGHDCVVGDHNIFANAATLAGHVELEHHVFLSGLVAVHQFCRVGAYVMVGGVSGVRQDIPPFLLAFGDHARILGLNIVGLRRHGFTAAQRGQIKAVYRTIFRGGLRLAEALAEVEAGYPTDETRHIIRFIESSRRGIASLAPTRSQRTEQE
ncbi:acyl-ACP--UDP-N-acetylglucosamine O-acyltransferase [Thioalkalicoccus limnaeus]|uniref:Acyl-ACP--UDP-N-acetylglucosamine O-acyltransferase n=1 Tax=Thioalkalicoccus limnaeus TaxID=120681 RepID=A0ABV4BFI8_9GAMM